MIFLFQRWDMLIPLYRTSVWSEYIPSLQLVAPKSTWHDKDYMSNGVFTISTGYFSEISACQACQFFAPSAEKDLSPQGVSWPGWKDEFVLKWHDPMRSMPSSHPGIFTDLVERHIGPLDRHQCLIQMTMELVKTWTAGVYEYDWCWSIDNFPNSKSFFKMVTPSNSLVWSIYTLLVFRYGIRDWWVSTLHGSTVSEPTGSHVHHRLLPCRPGGSIHVTGVKSLQVHTMLSTCVDVDTRRKGPIQNTLRGGGGALCSCFF